MKVYLVGGAVRDLLLGESINEYDWVVVGTTPETMLELGFQQVGKDFPVFLHPFTHEEYALARTERKSAHGYTGFNVHTSPKITLEDDLIRRDLTINAIALDIEKLFNHKIEHHKHKNPLVYLLSLTQHQRLSDFSRADIHDAIIDPYNGLMDLDNRVLKHISSAFSEDPLRVIRLARFAARFAHLGFTIDNSTLLLTQQMSESGELSFLIPERVWKETEKALSSTTPSRYFESLIAMQALVKIYPSLHDAIESTSIANTKNEFFITAEQRFVALNEGAKHQLAHKILFTLLFTVLLTPSVNEQNGNNSNIVNSSNNIKLSKEDFFTECKNWRIPNEYRDCAWAVGNNLNIWPAIPTVSAEPLLDLFNQLNTFKQDALFDNYCCICDLLYQGSYLQGTNRERKLWLKTALEMVRKVQPKSFIDLGFKGAEIKEALHTKRLEQLKAYLLSH